MKNPRVRVMFVCLGNICRSPLAQAVFEHRLKAAGLHETVEAESSGIGAWHVGEPPDERMRRTARRHGIAMNHRARRFSASDLVNYDLVLAMDAENLAGIRRLVPPGSPPGELADVRLFRDYDPHARPGAEVPDPYYGGDEGFEEVFEMVDRTAAALVEKLKTDEVP